MHWCHLEIVQRLEDLPSANSGYNKLKKTFIQLCFRYVYMRTFVFNAAPVVRMLKGGGGAAKFHTDFPTLRKAKG